MRAMKSTEADVDIVQSDRATQREHAQALQERHTELREIKKGATVLRISQRVAREARPMTNSASSIGRVHC
jgi:hypothetical protein